MLYQVIGVERKTGDFTPRDGSNRQIHYDNLVLHSVTLKRLVGCAGQKAEQCSIKVVDSADLLESVGAMDDFSKVIGHQFDFETSYGKIKSWELVKKCSPLHQRTPSRHHVSNCRGAVFDMRLLVLMIPPTIKRPVIKVSAYQRPPHISCQPHG